MIKIILTVIFFVSSVSAGLFVVYPLYEDYQVKMEENEVLVEELENVKVYIAELEKIDEKIEDYREEVDFIASAFPEDHDAPTLFLYLQNKMEEHNVEPVERFGSFSVNPYQENDSDHSRIREVSFDLSLEGSYENIKNFLREVEGVIRVTSIEEVSFSADETPFGAQETGEDINVRVNMKAFSY